MRNIMVYLFINLEQDSCSLQKSIKCDGKIKTTFLFLLSQIRIPTERTGEKNPVLYHWHAAFGLVIYVLLQTKTVLYV